MPGRVLWLLFLVTAAAPAALLLDHRGQLQPGSEQLPTGEYAQTFRLDIPAGELVEVRLTGAGLDPYLLARLPHGAKLQNDDFDGQDARLAFISPVAGELLVVATTAQPGERGGFHLEVETFTPDGPLTAIRDLTGELRAGDATLPTGELRHQVELDLQRGQILRVRLESSAFRPYLGLTLDGYPTIEVDDVDGTAAELACRAPADGLARLTITTVRPGEAGAYRLLVWADRQTADRAAQPVPPATGPAESHREPGAVSLDEVGAGTPEFNPRDPRLRLQPPTPDPAAVAAPGILSETLHRRRAIQLELAAIHRWSDVSRETRPDGQERQQDRSGEEYEKIELATRHALHSDGPDWEGELNWQGNTFTAHWAAEVRQQHFWDRPTAYEQRDLRVVDVSGVVSPTGDRITLLRLHFYQSLYSVGRHDGKHEYQLEQASQIAVQDLPFDPSSLIYPESREGHTLATATARWRQRNPTGDLDRERLFYRAEGPAAARHLLSLTHRVWRPAFGGPTFHFFSRNERAWQGANWLEGEPRLTVQFVR